MKLDKMDRDELLQLQRDVTAALKSYEDRQKKDAYSKLETMAREMGYSLTDFAGGKKPKANGGVPKYVHPENPSKTWSGRGRQPDWFKEAIASGKSESEMLI